MKLLFKGMQLWFCNPSSKVAQVTMSLVRLYFLTLASINMSNSSKLAIFTTSPISGFHSLTMYHVNKYLVLSVLNLTLLSLIGRWHIVIILIVRGGESLSHCTHSVDTMHNLLHLCCVWSLLIKEFLTPLGLFWLHFRALFPTLLSFQVKL